MSDDSEFPDAECPEVLGTVAKWLSPAREVYVHTDYWHTGGPGLTWFVRSLADYQNLVRSQGKDKRVAICRKQRYPLRGVAGDALLAEALALIKEGDWYHIVGLDGYPKNISYYGGGNSHKELRRDMEQCRGMTVGVGLDMDSMADLWPKEELLVVCTQRA